MAQKIEEDIVYKSVSAAEIEGYNNVYEGCTFLKCDFSYADFAKVTFINCVMDTCNLSLIKTDGTGFQDVKFVDCKITGTNFSNCNNFSLSLSFDRCQLNYTVFQKKKLKATKFIDCSLEEADFSEADLTSALFRKCNLNRTIFNRTILRSADLSTAYNFDIDPENNTLAKAKFSADSLAGLLTKHSLNIV